MASPTAPSSSRSNATSAAAASKTDMPVSSGSTSRASRPPASRGKPASKAGAALPPAIPEGQAVEGGAAPNGAEPKGQGKVDGDGDAVMESEETAAAAVAPAQADKLNGNGTNKTASGRAARGAVTPTSQAASSRGLERRQSVVSVPASRRRGGRRSVAGAPDVNELARPIGRSQCVWPGSDCRAIGGRNKGGR